MSFEVKLDQKSVVRAEETVRQAFKKVINNKEMLNEIGTTLVKDIQFQTKRGVSIPNESRISPLSASWIERRDSLSSVNSTSEVYGKRRSNLSFTGQLLNSVKHFILGPGKIEIKATGNRQPYKNLNGTNQKNTPSNEELADFVAEQGRKFIGVRAEMKPRLRKIVLGFIRRSSRVLNLFNINGQ